MLEIIPPDYRCFSQGATHSIYVLLIVLKKGKKERRRKEQGREREEDLQF